MSLRDVSEIIQEYDPTKRKLSPRIKALNLFGEGKTILEVMMALNMPYEEAKIVEEQHLAIQNRPKAAKLYKECENKDYLDSILKLYSLLMVNKVNIEELDDLIYYSREIPELRKTFNALNFEVSRLKQKKSVLESEISELILTKQRQSTYLSQIKSQLFSMQRHNDELGDIQLTIESKDCKSNESSANGGE